MTDEQIMSQASEEQFNVACDATDASKDVLSEASVIKALGICTSEHLGCEDGCPYVEVPCLGGDALLKDALALINCQKAEIEKLRELYIEAGAEIERLHKEGLQLNKTFMDFVNVEKYKAIKEFWEKTKNTREYRTCPYVYISDGDNLVKEMTE